MSAAHTGVKLIYAGEASGGVYRGAASGAHCGRHRLCQREAWEERAVTPLHNSRSLYKNNLIYELEQVASS